MADGTALIQHLKLPNVPIRNQLPLYNTRNLYSIVVVYSRLLSIRYRYVLSRVVTFFSATVHPVQILNQNCKHNISLQLNLVHDLLCSGELELFDVFRLNWVFFQSYFIFCECFDNFLNFWEYVRELWHIQGYLQNYVFADASWCCAQLCNFAQICCNFWEDLCFFAQICNLRLSNQRLTINIFKGIKKTHTP